MVNSYAYEPFGTILSEQETIVQPFKYVGQYGVMAEPNGLYYMRARYYDPSVGRFISEDPLGFGGGDVNLFAYVQNNPVNWVDPLGLWGFAVNSGGALEGGIGMAGAYQAESGGGVFWGGSSGVNVGAYTASGGFAGIDQGFPWSENSQFVAGATGGLGAGGFITNAEMRQTAQGTI